MRLLEDFFQALDAAWGTSPEATPLRLPIIGSAALMLQTNYRRGTKDSDVLETTSLREGDKRRLLELGGVDSKLCRQHKLYVDVVSNGLPLLPHGPCFHSVETLNSSLTYLHIDVLDIVDVVVSKLKRFHANDQSDIAQMVDRDLVSHAKLVTRFLSAVDLFSIDARADALPQYIANFHRVEREHFGAAPTLVHLPDWT